MKSFNNQKGFATIFVLPIILVIVIGILFLLIKSTSFNDKAFIQKTTSNDSVPPKTSTALNLTGISFVRDGNIWLADIDGNNERQITKEGIGETYYWIPKTNKIVFDRIDEGAQQVVAEIRILDTDTGLFETIHKRTIKLGNIGEIYPHFYFDFKLSSKGTMVGYTGDFIDSDAGEFFSIYNFTTKKTSEIKQPGMELAFSPDEAMLAGMSGGYIYTYSLKNSDVKKIISYVDSEQAYESNPSKYAYFETPYNLLDWRKDGSGIFYYFGNYGKGAPPEEATQHIYFLNIKSSEAKQITSSSNGEIDWYLDQTTDGKEIYYLVFDGKQYDYFLRKSNLDNKQTKKIDLCQGMHLSSSEFALDVTEDGSKIIYECRREDASYYPVKKYFEVWIMNSDGTENRKLFDNASNPMWRY